MHTGIGARLLRNWHILVLVLRLPCWIAKTSTCIITTEVGVKQFSLRTDFGYYEAKKVQIPSNQGI